MSKEMTLASEIKAWRGKVPVRVVADLLGMSPRTLNGIEQGRPFPYPHLLRVAMQTIDPNEGRDVQAS